MLGNPSSGVVATTLTQLIFVASERAFWSGMTVPSAVFLGEIWYGATVPLSLVFVRINNSWCDLFIQTCCRGRKEISTRDHMQVSFPTSQCWSSENVPTWAFVSIICSMGIWNHAAANSSCHSHQLLQQVDGGIGRFFLECSFKVSCNNPLFSLSSQKWPTLGDLAQASLEVCCSLVANNYCNPCLLLFIWLMHCAGEFML